MRSGERPPSWFWVMGGCQSCPVQRCSSAANAVHRPMRWTWIIAHQIASTLARGANFMPLIEPLVYTCCVRIPTTSAGPPPPRNTAVLLCPLPPLVNHSGTVPPDFKGFIVPVEAGPPEGASIGGPVSAADDPTSQFLTRGFAMRKRVSLEGVTVQVEEPVSCWL